MNRHSKTGFASHISLLVSQQKVTVRSPQRHPECRLQRRSADPFPYPPADALHSLGGNLGRVIPFLFRVPQDGRDFLYPWVGAPVTESCELGRVDEGMDEGSRHICRYHRTPTAREECNMSEEKNEMAHEDEDFDSENADL